MPFYRKVGWALATWFGCGFVPVAPGTAGTLGAIPLYFAVRAGGPPAILATAAVVTAIGVWAAGIVAEDRGTHDPQIVVIDEAAGVLLALAFAGRSLPGVGAAFVLFRLFDTTKPFPARRLERLPGGWGIVLDDIAAGVWAAACLAGLRAAGVLA
jgi:phosphatidylglycerophosphatase A